MGACRESYKISTRWKWGGKTISEKLRSINTVMVDVILHRGIREMFIKDNFTQPFNKHIGCKIFGHNYRKDYHPVEYICLKCWKRITEQQHDSNTRRKKLKKIKSKIWLKM